MRRLIAGVSLTAVTIWASAAQPFSYELIQSNLFPRIYGSVSWADADLDGKMDVLITGSRTDKEPYEPSSTLYLTREPSRGGAATRQDFDERVLPVALWHSAAAWSDFDRDGDPDVVLMGAVNVDEPYQAWTVLFENDGTGSLTETTVDLPGLYSGSVEWGDYDNDGDADLLLTGILEGGAYATQLYRNDGASAFTPVETYLPGVGHGCARFGDYDGDRDLDVIVTGQAIDGYLTRIYRNDGASFTQIELDPGFAVTFSAAAWGGHDDDGDLDALVAGGVIDRRLYRGRFWLLENHGSDRFTGEMLDDEGFLGGSVAWGDVDLDGDLDAMGTGAFYPAGPRAARLYFNASGSFRPSANLPGTLFGEAAFGDLDNDGDLDLIMTGVAAASTDIANLYVNTQLVVNDPPQAPGQMQASVNGGRVTLTWSEPSDDRSAKLTYNLRIGTTQDSVDRLSPIADPKTGRRYVEGFGNVFQNTGWVIDDLPPGTYWWSVQAVDDAYAGSSFSQSQSFTVPPR